MSIKVSIVEDDARIRESMAALLNDTSGFRCLGTYPNAQVALKRIPGNWPDVLIMDINLPGMSGIDCVEKLKEIHPTLEILMFTVDDGSDPIFKSLQAGASGYLVKGASPVEILEAVAEIHRGGSPMSTHIARRVVQHFQQIRSKDAAMELLELSDRELEIVTCLSKGFRYKEIANALSISPHTVRSHIRRIYEKLNVTSRTEAAMKFTRGRPL
jgi:DNA-binding NarL/FixJ family response regulator